MDGETHKVYRFGDYRIDPFERVLRKDDEIVSLQPRAIELLLVLIENKGRVVAKEDLLNRVWQGQFVEEANLSHTVFQLRKALGGKDASFIETVPKRGYRFAAPVEKSFDAESPGLLLRENSVTRILLEEEVEESPQRTGAHSAALLTEGGIRLARALPLAAIGIALVAVVAASYLYQKQGSVASDASISFTRVTNSGKNGASTISPDGRFIAYSQNYRSGEGMLFARQTDTNHELRLIEPREITFGGLAFSPDSRFVYYVVYDTRDPKGALYRVPVLGGVSTRLLEKFGSMFTISPDGTEAAFYRNSNETKSGEILIGSLDGSGRERTVYHRTHAEMIFTGVPAFSPDGKTISFGGDDARRADKPYLNAALFDLDIESGTARKLADETWSEIGNMRWLADSTGIVLVGRRPRVGNQIYFYDTRSGVARQLTTGLQGYGNYGMGVTADGTAIVADLWEAKTQIWSIAGSGDPSTSRQLTSGETDGRYGLSSLPDGSVVYVARVGNEFDIWRAADDGSGSKPLTADAFSQSDVVATRDGRLLIFASDVDGMNHIFRSNADGTDRRQLTFGETADTAPDVSPDGNWIVYASWFDRKTTIKKVSIDGGEPVTLTEYDAVAPAISPDGSMISCVLRSDSRAEPARIAVLGMGGGAPIKEFPVLQFGYWYRAPRWSPDGKFLVFHRDERNIGNLWKQPLDGSPPQQLTTFNTDLIYNYSYSHDGSTLLVSRGRVSSDVVMIKNFLSNP